MPLSRAAGGALLAVASAACFATLAILAKLAYAAGMNAIQLIAWRMLLAAVGMNLIAAIAGQSPVRLERKKAVGLFAMGLFGYSLQAYTFLGALQTLPASLVELVLYTYPALVALAGWLLFKSRIPKAHLLALATSFVGVALLLGGIKLQGVSAAGVALMLVCPFLYTAYLLAGDRLTLGAPPLAASALTITGAAITLTLIAAASGHLQPPPSSRAWAVTAGVVVIPTMVAISLVLAAIPRIGAPRTALLSTAEPVVTVGLAFAILGDRFSPLQAVGAGLVLAAILVLQWRR